MQWLYNLIKPERIVIKVKRKDNGNTEYRIAEWDGHYYTETHILHRDEDEGPALIVPDAKIYEYYQYGVLSRKNGPARMDIENGVDEWFLNGKRHRMIHGPTITYANGDYVYHLNGLKHRDDGPAVRKLVGKKEIFEYWLKGEMVRREEKTI